MKIESYIFAFVAILLGGSGGVYWFTSHDPAGTALLVFGTALGVLVGSFILLSGRRVGPRPEDNPESEIAEGAGEVGFFSPHSWWPLPLAATASIVFLGLAVGWWLVIIGTVLGALALVGWVFEYWRGAHAH